MLGSPEQLNLCMLSKIFKCQFSVRHRPGNDGNAAGLLDGLEPCLLLGPDPSGRGLDLDAGEDGQAGADHGWGDGDGAPADQVSGSAGKAEGDEPPGAGIWQAADLVAEDAGFRVGAKC